MMIIKTK